MVVPARVSNGAAGFLGAYHCGVFGKVCALRVRGRGRKEYRAVSEFGAASAALIAKQLNGSEGLLLSAPLRVVASALQTLK